VHPLLCAAMLVKEVKLLIRSRMRDRMMLSFEQKNLPTTMEQDLPRQYTTYTEKGKLYGLPVNMSLGSCKVAHGVKKALARSALVSNPGFWQYGNPCACIMSIPHWSECDVFSCPLPKSRKYFSSTMSMMRLCLWLERATAGLEV